MDILRLLRIAALLSVVLVLNTAIVLMITQARGTVTAQVSPPCVDGDVNGDAGLNIGDPIYLLQHLFQGGPGPVACAQPGGLTPSELALLQQVLSHVSIEEIDVDSNPATPDGAMTIRFTGVNIQLVNGLGATNGDPSLPASAGGPLGYGISNGLGNLIIGYAEESVPETEVPTVADRSGSHNLVVGPGHTWGSYGGIVAGANNQLAYAYNSVLAGSYNISSGFTSGVLAGHKNFCTANYSSIVGGSDNVVTGEHSSVLAGSGNQVSGVSSAVICGGLNAVHAFESSVLGGENNRVLDFGSRSTIGSGRDNTVSRPSCAIMTGERNEIAGGFYSAIVSGTDSDLYGDRAAVLAGQNNWVSGNDAAIVAGTGGNVSNLRSAILAGENNAVTGEASAVTSGSNLTAGPGAGSQAP